MKLINNKYPFHTNLIHARLKIIKSSMNKFLDQLNYDLIEQLSSPFVAPVIVTYKKVEGKK